MKKNRLIACLFAFIILFVPMTSVVGAFESEDCSCQVVKRQNPDRVERFLDRLEVYINIISLRYRHIPKVEESCHKILGILNSDNSNEILCLILMRIGIFIEELVKKFPEGTIVYPFLVLMMFPIIILWNKFCDENILSIDLSRIIPFNSNIKI